jgi:hypothetical protein
MTASYAGCGAGVARGIGPCASAEQVTAGTAQQRMVARKAGQALGPARPDNGDVAGQRIQHQRLQEARLRSSSLARETTLLVGSRIGACNPLMSREVSE